MSSCQVQITEAESIAMLDGFLKSAEESSTLDTNKGVSGLSSDDYDNPPQREEREGTTNALWGQEGAEDSPQQHSNAVWDGFKAGRERFLQRNFDGFAPSKEQAVKELGSLLDHFKDGDHESSGPSLRDSSDRTPVVAESVFDKTKRLLG